MSIERPLGVTILAILAAISGILSIIGGITLMALGPMLAAAGPGYRGMGLLTGMAAGLGAFLIVIGLLDLVVAWGYWTAKGWAWTVGVILAIIGILMGIVNIQGGGWLGLILNVIILYYLFRPHVKQYFGRG